MKQLIVSLFLMGSIFQSALAEVVLIVHPENNSSFNASSISKIFLGKVKSFENGTKITLYSLPEGNAITDEFNQSALGRDSTQLKAYWSKLVFTGKGTPPKEIESESAIIAEIAKDPSGIGFVSAGAATGDVKVVGTY